MAGDNIKTRLPAFQDHNDPYEMLKSKDKESGNGLWEIVEAGYEEVEHPLFGKQYVPKDTTVLDDPDHAERLQGILNSNGRVRVINFFADYEQAFLNENLYFDPKRHIWTHADISEDAKAKGMDEFGRLIFDKKPLYKEILCASIDLQLHDDGSGGKKIQWRRRVFSKELKGSKPLTYVELKSSDVGETAFEALVKYLEDDARKANSISSEGLRVNTNYEFHLGRYFELKDKIEEQSDEEVTLDFSKGFYAVADLDKKAGGAEEVVVAMIRAGFLKQADQIDIAKQKIIFKAHDGKTAKEWAQEALDRICHFTSDVEGNKYYDSASQTIAYYMGGAHTESKDDDTYQSVAWAYSSYLALDTDDPFQAHDYTKIKARYLNQDNEYEEKSAYYYDVDTEVSRFADSMADMQSNGIPTSYFEFYALVWDKKDKQPVHMPIVTQGPDGKPSMQLSGFEALEQIEIDREKYELLTPEKLEWYLEQPSTFKRNDIQTFFHPDYLFLTKTTRGGYVPIVRAPVFNRELTTSGYEKQQMQETRRLRIEHDGEPVRVNLTFDEVITLDRFVKLVDPISGRQSIHFDKGTDPEYILNLDEMRELAHQVTKNQPGLDAGDLPLNKAAHRLTEGGESVAVTAVPDLGDVSGAGLEATLNYQVSFSKLDVTALIRELHKELTDSGYPQDYHLDSKHWLPDTTKEIEHMWDDPLDPDHPDIEIRGLKLSRRRAAFLEMAFRLYVQDVDTMGLNQQDLFRIQEEMQNAMMKEQNLWMGFIFGGLNIFGGMLQILLPILFMSMPWYRKIQIGFQRDIMKEMFKTESDGKDDKSDEGPDETKFLSVYGKDLRRYVAEEKGNNTKIVGREELVQNMLEIMNIEGNANSLLLTGQAGVGKTAVIEYLAELMNKGDVPPKFQNTMLIELDVNKMISGTAYRGQFEARVSELVETIGNFPIAEAKLPGWTKRNVQFFKKWKSGEISRDSESYKQAYRDFMHGEMIENMIRSEQKEARKHGRHLVLFIDEIHSTVNAGATKDGGGNMWQFLKPLLAKGELTIIGATTTQEKHIFLDADEALAARFAEEIVTEPPRDIVVEKIIPSETKDAIESNAIVDEFFLAEYFDVSGDFYDVIFDMARGYFKGGHPRVGKLMAAKYVNHKYMQWWKETKAERKEIETKVERYKQELLSGNWVSYKAIVRKVTDYRQQLIEEFKQRQLTNNRIQLNREDLLDYAKNKLVPQNIKNVQGRINAITQELQAMLQLSDEDIGFDQTEAFKLHSADNEREKRIVDNKLQALQKVKALVSGTSFRTTEHNRLIKQFLKEVNDSLSELPEYKYTMFEQAYKAVTDGKSPASLIDDGLRDILSETDVKHERYVSQLRDVYYPGDGETEYRQRISEFESRIQMLGEYVRGSLEADVDKDVLNEHVKKALESAIQESLDRKYEISNGHRDYTIVDETIRDLDQFFTDDQRVKQRYKEKYQDLKFTVIQDSEASKILGQVMVLETQIVANTNLHYSELYAERFRLVLYRELAKLITQSDQYQNLDDRDKRAYLKKYWSNFLRQNTKHVFKLKRGFDKDDFMTDFNSNQDMIVDTMVDTFMTMSDYATQKRRH